MLKDHENGLGCLRCGTTLQEYANGTLYCPKCGQYKVGGVKQDQKYHL